jgi:hypothetical protein
MPATMFLLDPNREVGVEQEARKNVTERLNIREKAHARLDEALDMYEENVPLWIVCRLGWSSFSASTRSFDHELAVTIKEISYV